MSFFEEVSKTNVGPIFDYLKKPDRYDGVAESFLIDFINAFCPINCLDVNELKQELQFNIDALKYVRIRYPNTINKAIKEVRMLRL